MVAHLVNGCTKEGEGDCFTKGLVRGGSANTLLALVFDSSGNEQGVLLVGYYLVLMMSVPNLMSLLYGLNLHQYRHNGRVGESGLVLRCFRGRSKYSVEVAYGLLRQGYLWSQIFFLRLWMLIPVFSSCNVLHLR